jgi:hypothetical protein
MRKRQPRPPMVYTHAPVCRAAAAGGRGGAARAVVRGRRAREMWRRVQEGGRWDASAGGGWRAPRAGCASHPGELGARRPALPDNHGRSRLPPPPASPSARRRARRRSTGGGRRDGPPGVRLREARHATLPAHPKVSSGAPAPRACRPRVTIRRQTPCTPWPRAPSARRLAHPHAGGRGDGQRAAGGRCN